MKSVILYTRKDCHLCDDALSILSEHGITPEIVDIDENPELQKEFDTCVPVVKLGARSDFAGESIPYSFAAF